MLKRGKEREREEKIFDDEKKKITILTLIPRYLVLLVIVYYLQRPLLVVQRVQDLVQRWISLLLVQEHDQLIEIDRVRFALGAGNKVQVRIKNHHHFVIHFGITYMDWNNSSMSFRGQILWYNA